MKIKFISPVVFALVLAVALISCKGEKKLTDQETIEKNVRAFFMMGDSVDLEITITDTMYIEELQAMMETVEENNLLIQLDIDTLSLMIDDWNYKALDLEKTNQILPSKDAKIKALEYKLKMRELESKKAVFAQTNRILLRLQRSIWANIAGFEAKVHYQLGDEISDLEILMDANFNVID